MRDLPDLPLFIWAANRPAEPEPTKASGIVINAENRFLAREMAHLRLIMIGYIPPETGGSPPISIADFTGTRPLRGQIDGRATA